MFFVVQPTPPPGQVPPERHLSIQQPLDAGRVVLDAAVPDDVLRDHGRLRHLPPAPAPLDGAARRRFVLDQLRERVDNAPRYLRVSPEDLPPFVWEFIAAGGPVVFVWADPKTGERIERVVRAVPRDDDRLAEHSRPDRAARRR
ncbi:hypothetical protein [Micromonospora sp. CPCC 205561]|uniref:hypothetical protein n=1 Tax=Micromonospora sp. CPCC 205561 TaxID=3122407 RepID=UPI002FF021AE